MFGTLVAIKGGFNMTKPRRYTASKQREKSGQRYSVIYRHPVRIDPSTGKPGRRVRRSLGTNDEAEADRLINELNILLGDDKFWTLSARPSASDRFDPRVVSIFYDGMEPGEVRHSRFVRDEYIPLPGTEEGYKRILLLGTTGSGKTTLIRQLLGTDPEDERFPSTSTAKTTIADTEIVINNSATYESVVTFARKDEVIDHFTDCVSRAATLLVLQNSDKIAVRRALLDHKDQRFRFSYVLGRHAESAPIANGFSDFDDPDEDGKDVHAFGAQPDILPGIDLDKTERLIKRSMDKLQTVAQEIEARVQENLALEQEGNHATKEMLEEEHDRKQEEFNREIGLDERFHEIVDALLDEIEKRFDALTDGKIIRDQQGWPQAWIFKSESRTKFLKAVNRFSSNYAPLFGQLLSPLVDGIRVTGRFRPEWWENEAPRLVLIDGEGLGHTPKSAAALPTALAETINEVNGVLLVDNAMQPVQAAPAEAIRSILTAGNIEKLIFCFTHFDEVRGDNLVNPNDRAEHILASVENLVSSFREEYHPSAEHAVRRRLDGARFFLANIDQQLSPTDREHKLTISQLKKLVGTLEKIDDPIDIGAARPTYDKTNFVLAITKALELFHRRWNAILGIKFQSDVDKEHWRRIKALSRRFAEGSSDQYHTLRPAADLREFLKDEIYRTVNVPLGWKGQPSKDDAEKEAIIDKFLNKIANRLIDVIRRRLSVDPITEWQTAYALRGKGSTFERADQISSDIFARKVPVPSSAPSPDKNRFLHEIIEAIQVVATEEGVELH